MKTAPLIYVECDVPEGLTLNEYRRGATRPAVRRRRRLRSLLRLRPVMLTVA